MVVPGMAGVATTEAGADIMVSPAITAATVARRRGTILNIDGYHYQQKKEIFLRVVILVIMPIMI
jgi:hypothetical protein